MRVGYVTTVIIYIYISNIKVYYTECGSRLVAATTCCRPLDRSLFPPSESTVKYKDAAGKVRFKGAGKKLKETQVYPPRFGRKAGVCTNHKLRSLQYNCLGGVQCLLY